MELRREPPARGKGASLLMMSPPCDIGVRDLRSFFTERTVLPSAGPENASLAFSWILDNVGGINVNRAAAHCNLDDLRAAASSIAERRLNCRDAWPWGSGSSADWQPSVRFCGWEADIVSDAALNGFQWERHLWTFVHDAFTNDLLNSPPCTNSPTRCRAIGFLDIGVNIGDWLTPLRLALPGVPLVGVEGSPANVALAAANAAESVRHARQHAQVAATRIMPFALLSPSELRVARHAGGLCFSQDHFNVRTLGIPDLKSPV